MRTRTLLLLAVGCGLLILGAGVAQLLRIATRDDPPVPAAIGDVVRAGDLAITVHGYDELGGYGVVLLELGGVEDPDGTEEFRLVVPGSSLAADRSGVASGDGACDGTTVSPARCTLTFDLADTSGTSRVLLFRRGDEQVRWELATS